MATVADEVLETAENQETETDSPEYYENRIKDLFYEYFSDRDIDITGLSFKGIPNNVYYNAFIYIFKNLFKPLNPTYKHVTDLDYDNIDLLYSIAFVFNDLCTQYNILGRSDMFMALTGIPKSTWYDWRSGNTRCYEYFDLSGNKIKHINTWLMLNPGGQYEKKATSSYSDLVKKIEGEAQSRHKNSLNDDLMGRITNANNDEELGLNYARVNAQQQAEGVRLSIDDIRQQIGIAGGQAQSIPEIGTETPES